MPKVSICIPTFEQVEYLRKCLDSVLIQNYSDYEVIITDDSRTDRVKTLISEYDFGGKLKYYKNEVRLGSPENWNEAIRKANGEYIKILHHDEWFNYKNSLLKFVDVLDNNIKIDFVFCAAQGYDVGQNFYWQHRPTKVQLETLKADPLILFFGNFIGAPSNTMFRRNQDLTFDSNLIWCVDFEFYIRILLKTNLFYYIDDDLLTSVSNAKHNITNDCVNNKNIEVFEYLYILKKFSSFSTLRKNFRYISFFRKLFKKYSINTIKEIRDCGYNSRLPNLVNFSLLLNRFFE